MKKFSQLKAFVLIPLIAGWLLSCSKSSVSPKNQVQPSPVVVSTFAGSAVKGDKDGTGTEAAFYNPTSIAVDAQGNFYVTDVDNYLIRKITPAGVVSTFAGSGHVGFANGTGTAASFGLPLGIAIDGNGNLYVADATNKLIRKITPAGVVSTFAGSGKDGEVNGTGTAASFKTPGSIAIDAAGNLYVTDYYSIRKITPAGVVSTFADDGTPSGFSAGGIAIDAAGNLYVTDSAHNQIRKITSAGVISVFAGNGTKGSDDGKSASASFNEPLGITFDSKGNLFVGGSDYRVRMISTDGMVTTIAGNGVAGDSDGPGMQANFLGLDGMAVSGNALYVADTGNNSIRKITF
jgi:sugar lactone lactonase YvrE